MLLFLKTMNFILVAPLFVIMYKLNTQLILKVYDHSIFVKVSFGCIVK